MPIPKFNFFVRRFAYGVNSDRQVFTEPLSQVGVQFVQSRLAKLAGLGFVFGVDQYVSGDGCYQKCCHRLFFLFGFSFGASHVCVATTTHEPCFFKRINSISRKAGRILITFCRLATFAHVGLCRQFETTPPSRPDQPKPPQRGERGAKFGGSRPSQALRHQHVGTLAGDGEAVACRHAGEQFVAVAKHMFDRAVLDNPIVKRAQLVGDLQFRHRDFAIGQIADLTQFINEHVGRLLFVNRELPTFCFDETSFVAFGKVAKDRAVKRRVRCLATGALPIAFGFHRFDHLFRIHRLGRFAEYHQRGGDTAYFAVWFLRYRLGSGFFLRLLQRASVDRRVLKRLDSRRFRFDHGDVAGFGDLRVADGNRGQSPSRLDRDLLAGRQVRRRPTTGWFHLVDADFNFLVGHGRFVNAADSYFVLLHLAFSKKSNGMSGDLASIGCHRQAAGTTHRDTGRLRAASVSALDSVSRVPSPFRSVSELSAFYDVDEFAIIRIVFLVGIVFGQDNFFGRSESLDPIFEGPVLLGHQADLNVSAQLVAVVGQSFNHFVDCHGRVPFGFGFCLEFGLVISAGHESDDFRQPAVDFVEVADVAPVDRVFVVVRGGHVEEQLADPFDEVLRDQVGVLVGRVGVEFWLAAGFALRFVFVWRGHVCSPLRVEFVFFWRCESCCRSRLTHMSHDFLASSSAVLESSKRFWKILLNRKFAAFRGSALTIGQSLRDIRHVSPHVGPYRDKSGNVPLLLTYAIAANVGANARNIVVKRKRRVFLPSVGLNFRRSPNTLRGVVVLAGHLDQFRFDRFPIACLCVVGKFAEAFVAKVAFVPTLCPSESIVQPVQFRFAFARARSIPAAFRAFAFGVVPIAAAFRVQSQLYQSKAHLDVADGLRFVERAGEGPKFDAVSSAGEVRQVQKVIAIRFAALFGVVFVAVLFDLLAVDVSLAAFRSGAGEDRSFVVSDQRNQSCEGGRVAVPRNRYMNSRSFVDPSSASVDRVECVFYLLQPVVAGQLRRYEFASLAVAAAGSNARIPFGFPTRGQPRNLRSVVVAADRRGVVGGHSRFEFDSKSDVVGVHFEVPFFVGSCCFASHVCVAITHMSHAFRGTSSQFLHVSGSNLHVFFQATRSPVLAQRRGKTCPEHGANITKPGHSRRRAASVGQWVNYGASA